jgi:hypothetical protein
MTASLFALLTASGWPLLVLAILLVGLIITCGWLAAAATSGIISRIAGADRGHLSVALLVVPASSPLIATLNFGVHGMLTRSAASSPKTS